jgi:uncharacterized membrane protein
MNGETTTPQSRVVGALAYLLFFVSGVVLLYLDPYDKDPYVRFHARQSIGFSAAWFGVNVVLGVFVAILPAGVGALFGMVQSLVNLGLAILWIFLMYKAYTGEKYRIPELADLIDSVAPPTP